MHHDDAPKSFPSRPSSHAGGGGHGPRGRSGHPGGVVAGAVGRQPSPGPGGAARPGPGHGAQPGGGAGPGSGDRRGGHSLAGVAQGRPIGTRRVTHPRRRDRGDQRIGDRLRRIRPAGPHLRQHGQRAGPARPQLPAFAARERGALHPDGGRRPHRHLPAGPALPPDLCQSLVPDPDGPARGRDAGAVLAELRAPRRPPLGRRHRRARPRPRHRAGIARMPHPAPRRFGGVGAGARHPRIRRRRPGGRPHRHGGGRLHPETGDRGAARQRGALPQAGPHRPRGHLPRRHRRRLHLCQQHHGQHPGPAQARPARP